MQDALKLIGSLSLAELDAHIRSREQELLAWKTLRVIKRVAEQPPLTDVQLFDVIRAVQDGLGELDGPRPRSLEAARPSPESVTADRLKRHAASSRESFERAIEGREGLLRTDEIAELCGLTRNSAAYHLEQATLAGKLVKVGQAAYVHRNGSDPEFLREQYRQAGVAQGR